MESSKEEVSLLKENQGEEEEELITDFSQLFKGKGGVRRMPKLSSKQTESTPHWLLEVPSKLEITKEDLCQRKVLDQRRWKAMAKSNKESQDVLAAVVSSWNYLFSSKGVGQLPALTLKSAAEILKGREVEFESKGQYDRSGLLLTCFDCLCSEFKVKASGRVLMKPAIPNKVEWDQKTVERFLLGLKSQSNAYVLITTNNIVCPIGFEKTPLIPLEAYNRLEDIQEKNLQLWIMNGSVQRLAPSFVIKRWRHVRQCLETVWPYYIDLEDPKKGPIQHPLATAATLQQQRGTSCCLIELVREQV